MYKKLTTAIVATSLTLSLSPVAGAQMSSGSSFGSLSSNASSPSVSTSDRLEDLVVTGLTQVGQHRVAEWDTKADAVLREALDGKITLYNDPGYPEVKEATFFRDGLLYSVFLWDASLVEVLLANPQSVEEYFDSYFGALGRSAGYGLATGEKNGYVYIVIAENPFA